MTTSLIDAVHGIIHKNNPVIATTFITIFLAPQGDVDAQHKALNDFWRLHIGMQDVDSIEIRGYLADDISVNDWIFYFEDKVLPFILHHNVLNNEIYEKAAPW